MLRSGLYEACLLLSGSVALVGLGDVTVQHEGGVATFLLSSGTCVLANLRVSASGTCHAVSFGGILTRQQSHLLCDCQFTSNRPKVGFPLVSIGAHPQASLLVALDGCEVKGSASGGVCCADYASVTMDDCVVAENGTAGIEVRSGASLRMRSCNILKNSKGPSIQSTQLTTRSTELLGRRRQC